MKCVCCFEPKGLVGLAFVEGFYAISHPEPASRGFRFSFAELDDTKTWKTGERRNELKVTTSSGKESLN